MCSITNIISVTASSGLQRNYKQNSAELMIFSERELTFTFAICYCPSVCRLSVCHL